MEPSGTADVLSSRDPRVEAFVISWTGFGDASRRIAEALSPLVDRVVVVYSNREGATESGPGEWIQVPDSYYYSKKLQTSLEHFAGDVMLQVQADATSNDWPSLVAALKSAFQRPRMSMWAPVVDYSFWNLRRARIATIEESLTAVVTTDAVVWAVSADLCHRLRDFDYDVDRFGWGIDLAASAIAYSRGGEVVVDSRAYVDHPPSTSYDMQAAKDGSRLFVAQLSQTEIPYRVLLESLSETRIGSEHRPSTAQDAARLIAHFPGGRRVIEKLRKWRRAARGS